jgi:hypothetical protein
VVNGCRRSCNRTVDTGRTFPPGLTLALINGDTALEFDGFEIPRKGLEYAA